MVVNRRGSGAAHSGSAALGRALAAALRSAGARHWGLGASQRGDADAGRGGGAGAALPS